MCQLIRNFALLFRVNVSIFHAKFANNTKSRGASGARNEFDKRESVQSWEPVTVVRIELRGYKLLKISVWPYANNQLHTYMFEAVY